MARGHPCAGCGNDEGCFGFGFTRAQEAPPYWLCGTCWRLTPQGQEQTLQANMRLLGNIEDDDDVEFHTDAGLARDEYGADGAAR